MFPYVQIVLPTYSVMAFIGAFVSLVFLYFRIEKYEIEFTEFLKLCVVCIVGCFIGSKILFIITMIPTIAAEFSFTKFLSVIIESGFVFYGGLFGAIFALLYKTKKDADLRNRIFCFFVPAFALFHAFGRIGCLLGGCCYGKALDPHVVIPGIVEFGSIPVPLFESVFEFIMFAGLLLIEKKNPQCNVLKIYLIGYAIFRFFDEFFRGDTVRGVFFGLSTSQWISLAIVIFYTVKFINQKAFASRQNREIAVE